MYVHGLSQAGGKNKVQNFRIYVKKMNTPRAYRSCFNIIGNLDSRVELRL